MVGIRNTGGYVPVSSSDSYCSKVNGHRVNHGLISNLQGLPLYKDDRKPKIGLGLSAVGPEGPGQIGVLEFFDDHGINATKIKGKSSGAMVGASYAVLKQQYFEDPDGFGFKNPATKLREIYLKNQELLNFFNFPQAFKNEGWVNPEAIETLLDEVLGDRLFESVPDLEIIVHEKYSGRDIRFGKVGKNWRIKDAVRASLAIPGMISTLRVKDPQLLADISNQDYNFEVAYLADGCILRQSPLRELYDEDLDLRVCHIAGQPVHPQEIYDSFNATENGNFLEKLNPGRTQAKIVETFLRNLEIARRAGTNRDLHDFKEDVAKLSGLDFNDVVKGKSTGLIIVQPDYGFVRFGNHPDPEFLMKRAYEATAAAYERYIEYQTAIPEALQEQAFEENRLVAFLIQVSKIIPSMLKKPTPSTDSA